MMERAISTFWMPKSHNWWWVEVFRSVPFVFLFKKGTQAEMSVIGVRSVPYLYRYGKRNTIISVQERLR